MGQILIGVAALIHIYIFLMESIWWGKPKTNLVFGLSSDQAEQNRLFAFNQGYYNLFLAIAALSGILASARGFKTVGNTLMIYSCLSMVGAALVLLYSQRKLLRPALIQGVPPLIGIIALILK